MININVINKECCRDCTKCNLINEVQGFDFFGCAINQIFQAVRRIEKKQVELERRVIKSHNEQMEKEITIIQNSSNELKNETGVKELPKQQGAE